MGRKRTDSQHAKQLKEFRELLTFHLDNFTRHSSQDRKGLTTEHFQKDFEPFGISREYCDRHGIISITSDEAQKIFCRQVSERPCLGWIVVSRDHKGHPIQATWKADYPMPDCKYLQCQGLGSVPFITHDTRHRLEQSTTRVLLITEGIKKTLAAEMRGYSCIGLNGVWGFYGPGDDKQLSPHILRLKKLITRVTRVAICFDSDAYFNPQVDFAEQALVKLLRNLDTAIELTIVRLPQETNEKVGLDDYFATHSKEDFEALLELAFAAPPPKPFIGEKEPLELAKEYLDGRELIYSDELGFREYSPGHNHWRPLSMDRLKHQNDTFLDTRYSGVKKQHVDDVVFKEQSLTLLPRDMEFPCWREGIVIPDNFKDVDLKTEAFFAKNITLGLKRRPDGSRPTLTPTPQILNFGASSVHWVEPVPQPVTWINFLNEALRGNEHMIALLQEIFGYMLTPDNSFQKIFIFKGDPRSGKGIIARILTLLVGDENTFPATLEMIGSKFELEALIGKSFMPIDETRTGDASRNSYINEAVNTLLRISGETQLPVCRKLRLATKERLFVRALLICNEIPELPETAGAFNERIIGICTRRREGDLDRDLFKKLKKELSAILNWAIEGYERLHANGKFTEVPLREGEVSLVEQIAEAGAPVKTFGLETCEFGDTVFCDRDKLFSNFIIWRGNSDGKVKKAGWQSALLAAFPDVFLYRPGEKVDPDRRILLVGLKPKGQWADLANRPKHVETLLTGAVNVAAAKRRGLEIRA